MLNKIKARTPILALILVVISMSYTFAQDKVVVIPMFGEDLKPDCSPGFLVATAQIDVRLVSETEFSTEGVSRPYTCNGEDLLVKKSGAFRLQVVVDDGVDDDTIGSSIPKFGIVTTNGDRIFANGSQLLQCSPSIPPTILCMSFDFSDHAGSNAFPNDLVFVVVY